jgi:hypothetical protein
VSRDFQLDRQAIPIGQSKGGTIPLLMGLGLASAAGKWGWQQMSMVGGGYREKEVKLKKKTQDQLYTRNPK